MGPNNASAASARMIADSGRVKNTVQSTAEIVVAWRKFCSASGPRINDDGTGREVVATHEVTDAAHEIEQEVSASEKDMKVRDRCVFQEDSPVAATGIAACQNGGLCC